jgi:hypothetical protein
VQRANEFPERAARNGAGSCDRHKVEAAYRRGDLFAKRRQLAEAWERFIQMPASDGEVVSIRSRK